MYRRCPENSNPTNKGVKEPHIPGTTEASVPSSAEVQNAYEGILLLYKFVMRTMVDRKVESEAQIITLDGIKSIGLAE